MNIISELTTQTNRGRLTVVGTTSSTATNVTVNGTNASTYFDAAFAATNLPLTGSYTAIARDTYNRSSTNVVSVTLSTNSAFQYDLNGNLTNDGLRNFVYDDENELVEVLVTNQWMSQFQYDGKMRRRIRKEFTWTNSAWSQTNAFYYVYDGNLVLQERDQNNLPTVIYTRGLDLSSTRQGAGGIGGLLARTDLILGQTAFYHSEMRGNITLLVNSSNAVVARYLYDSFGNVLAKSGPLSDANLYRFSSKEAHPPSGLNAYLYRFCDPNLQRWLNRDPIQEAGGLNLYAFLGNAPVNVVDPYGLDPWYSWLNPFTYSSGWAQSQGVQALNAQLAANNTTLQQFQLDNPKWNGQGNLTAGNLQAVQAGANLAAGAANGEINLYRAILTSGVVTKAEQAAARVIAAANEEGMLSKLWNKCLKKNNPHFHHPWPKYFGGNPEQIFEPLPSKLHDAYHAGLDQIMSRFDGIGYFDSLPADQQTEILQVYPGV